MAKVAVIGAGVMGLAAAYHALEQGHEVDLYEAAPEAGGMAAHFQLGDLSIERFYHFICKTDFSTFALLDQLGIRDRLRWTPTSMGYFIDGKLNRWGDPISLLRFPGLGLISKFRYGLLAFVSAKRNRWDALETESAKHWITRWCGKTVYDRMWRPLFNYKFYEYADNVSAAWIWTRIKRTGRSRRSLMQEELGYLEGGSETLVHALVSAIEKAGGRIHLGQKVERILIESGAVSGLRVGGADIAADAVISTAPLPVIPDIAPDLPPALLDRYKAIANIGVVCVVLRLKRSVSRHFWVNIVGSTHEVPGIIEFSNLRPVSDTVVYVPYYMPVTNEKWNWSDQQFLDDAIGCINEVNSAVSRADVVTHHIGRLRYAQPICPPGFAAMLPPVKTPIAGLQIADTCFYYPEDRGISESVRFGKMMAETVSKGQQADS
jgi:protoporphyrinogen oxidase